MITEVERRPSEKKIRLNKYLAASVTGMNNASTAVKNMKGTLALLTYRKKTLTIKINAHARTAAVISS